MNTPLSRRHLREGEAMGIRRNLVPGFPWASWRLGVGSLATSSSSTSSASASCHASEGAAGTAVVGAPAGSPSLAMLLTRHILSDGELILLVLKPSIWYILFSSLRFIAVVSILVIAAKIYEEPLPYSTLMYVEAGIFVVAGRVMWAVLQWMGRLYILTDMRIVRIGGVFSVDVYDCPLRKVARTRLIATIKERVLRLGSIEIIPQDPQCAIGLWQMVKRPVEVNEQIIAAIQKAKHIGGGGGRNGGGHAN